MAGIIYSDYYLPDYYLPVWDFLKCSKFKHARDEDFCECFISQSKQESVCIETEKNEIQMLDVLLKRFFEKCSVELQDITQIIFTSPDNWSRKGVYIPYYLQENYGLQKASITGMVQECVTTLQTIQYAYALVNSGLARNVLIVSVCYGREMEDRYTGTTVVGDGASIVLVGNENYKCKISGCNSISDGRYSFYKYNNLVPKVGGLEIAKKGVEFISDLLKANNLTVDDLVKIIPQNINYSEYHMYSQYMSISIDKFFTTNISKGGHLAEVDSIRNYTDFCRDTSFSGTGKVLMYGSGTIGEGMDAVYNGVILDFGGGTNE